VWPGNHRSVWGSFWSDGQWGYNCCHSTIYNSYCVGEAGKRARVKELESKLMIAPKKTLVEVQ
jgi:pre-mRNA-processing factor SLU7